MVNEWKRQDTTKWYKNFTNITNITFTLQRNIINWLFLFKYYNKYDRKKFGKIKQNKSKKKAKNNIKYKKE